VAEYLQEQCPATDRDVFETQDVVLDRDQIDRALRTAKTTARERNVFIRHVGQRWTQQDIAHELGVSESTVQRDLRSVRDKLAAMRRADDID
jgi:RNA polymerase sigma factor (sigma-70 family)